MSEKLFSNPNQLWIADTTYEVKVAVQFTSDENGPFAHIQIFESDANEDSDDDEGLIARFDLERETLKVVLESGWHFGTSSPPEWNLDGEETIPPGTTIH